VGGTDQTTSHKVAGSIPCGVMGIFIDIILPAAPMALGSTQALREMSTKDISWEGGGGKGGRWVGLTFF